MTDTTSSTCGIGRRTYLQATSGLAVASTIGLAGCLGDDTDDSDDGNGDGEMVGTLATELAAGADAFDDFSDCTETNQGLWVIPALEGETDDTADETETGETDDGKTDDETETGESMTTRQTMEANRRTTTATTSPTSTPATTETTTSSTTS